MRAMRTALVVRDSWVFGQSRLALGGLIQRRTLFFLFPACEIAQQHFFANRSAGKMPSGAVLVPLHAATVTRPSETLQGPFTRLPRNTISISFQSSELISYPGRHHPSTGHMRASVQFPREKFGLAANSKASSETAKAKMISSSVRSSGVIVSTDPWRR